MLMNRLVQEYVSQASEKIQKTLKVLISQRPISSVSWVSDHRAGGRGFEPWADQHSGSLGNWVESAAFNYICKWLDFLVFSDKDVKP